MFVLVAAIAVLWIAALFLWLSDDSATRTAVNTALAEDHRPRYTEELDEAQLVA